MRNSQHLVVMGSAVVLALAAACAPPPPKVQTLFSAPPWTPEEFGLVGNAAFGGHKLHLAQVGGVWQQGLTCFKHMVPVGRDFEVLARFTHAGVQGSGRQGMSLIFHRDARGGRAIGGYGENFGFIHSDPRHAGIAPAAGFLFHFRSNLVTVVSTDSTNGAPKILARAPAPIAFGAGQAITVRYDSAKGMLSAWINHSQAPVIQAGFYLPEVLGGAEAWIGFAGTADKGDKGAAPDGEGAFLTEFIFNSIVPR